MRRMMMVMILGLLVIGVPGVQAQCSDNPIDLKMPCTAIDRWAEQEMNRIMEKNIRAVEESNRAYQDMLRLDAARERSQRNDDYATQSLNHQGQQFHQRGDDFQVKQNTERFHTQRRQDDFDRQQHEANDRLHHYNDTRDAAKKSFKYQ